MLQNLSNHYLLECYEEAKKIKLDPYFIFLLREEIKRRKLLYKY